jgi:hypothetical protein
MWAIIQSLFTVESRGGKGQAGGHPTIPAIGPWQNFEDFHGIS